MRKVKYLVIGAGISGLTFAYQKKDEDLIVLEKHSNAGGLCRSFYEGGFIFDVAGHFFHFHDEATKDFFHYLMEDRPLREVSKCAKVYYGDKYMDAPFQYNIHQLPIDEFLECLTSLYYAAAQEDSVSFKDFVRNKYGTGIADRFLIPYNEKLYACDMDTLETDSMREFLPRLDFDMLMSSYCGSHVKNYNDTFLYPVNGCEEIIKSLLGHIDNTKVHLDEEVRKIDFKNKLVYTDYGTYYYEFLVNTVPLPFFAHLAGLDKDIDELNYNKVLVLNLGFDLESINKDVHWIYFSKVLIRMSIGYTSLVMKFFIG